jgi:hypothetical protein
VYYTVPKPRRPSPVYVNLTVGSGIWLAASRLDVLNKAFFIFALDFLSGKYVCVGSYRSLRAATKGLNRLFVGNGAWPAGTIGFVTFFGDLSLGNPLYYVNYGPSPT